MQLQCTVNHNLGFVIGSSFCIIKWDILLQTWFSILSFISKHQVQIECSYSLTKGVSYLADLYLARFPTSLWHLLNSLFHLHVDVTIRGHVHMMSAVLGGGPQKADDLFRVNKLSIWFWQCKHFYFPGKLRYWKVDFLGKLTSQKS